MRCPPHTTCRELAGDAKLRNYLVDGESLSVTYMEGVYLEIACSRNVSLDSGSLPRFEQPARVANVLLRGCELPPGELARAFARLRFEPLDSLKLKAVRIAGADPELTATHLEGLKIRALEVDVAGPLSAADDLCNALAELRDLRLFGVRVRSAALLALPAGLRALWLERAELVALPQAALARLPALRRLELRDEQLAEPPDLSAAPALAVLVLRAPRLNALLAGPALQNATLYNMNLTRIGGNCSALENLALEGARAVAPDWAACPRLRHLRLRGCALPPGALAGARALTDLDLSGSGLRDLASGLWAAPPALRRLALSGNRLRARSLAALQPYTALQELTLSYNPLGDLCHATDRYLANGVSVLRPLSQLRVLRLRRTAATRVCRDWRALPYLDELDLQDNNITELEFGEASWARGALDLRGNPVATVRYSRDDYERALAAPAPPPNATVKLDSQLTCDCQLYWFANALRKRPQHVSPALAALHCEPLAEQLTEQNDEPLGEPRAGRLLLSVPLDELECPVLQDRCVDGCACSVGGELSVLRCARAGLSALPLPAPPLPPPRALFVAGNSIERLPRDLPPELTLLDLRDNALAELPAAEWDALLAPTRRLLLSGNPLRCLCAQRAALHLLRTHAAQLDAANMTCADGRALLDVRLEALCGAPPAALLGALLGAVLLLAMAALACLARPAARHWIKRFLVQHNVCLRLLLRPDREEDPGGAAGEAGATDEAMYDVFVSFSHHDHKFVVEELVPHLEGAARPRRLCLHYRDWTPGEWIPTQIAESVRRSRRTLVVLSEHFLRSEWARAEFREAHAAALRDARPRLVALLLAPPATLPADPALSSFLRTRTYLAHDDPRLWDKLLDALPATRRPAAPATQLPEPPDAPPVSPPAAPLAAPPCA